MATPDLQTLSTIMRADLLPAAAPKPPRRPILAALFGR